MSRGKSTLEKRLPFLQTVRDYNLTYFRRDVQASLTVALLDVPQAIAYSLIAGLPPVYGLYTSIVTALVTSLLNSSSHVVSGPTNAVSIMIASTLASANVAGSGDDPVALVALLTLLVGLTQLAFGLLKVGNLAQFLSRSVLVGFTAGAGLLIAFKQLAPMLGLELEKSEHFMQHLWATVTHLADLNPYAAGLGLVSVLIVILGKRYFPKLPSALFAVIICSFAVWLLDLENKGVNLIGALPSTLPPFSVPDFNLNAIAEIADDAIAIAILGLVESLSIGKSISVQSGERLDNNQDFVSLGTAQVVSSFFSCMPGCGSFTRSALNYDSGAATRFSGMFCAFWISLIILLFGSFARFIPTACLSGLLVVLGFSLIKVSHIRMSVRSTGSDAIVLILTFLCTLLLHLETAIFIGVISSLVLFLRKASAPHLVEYDMEGDQMREIRDPKDRTIPEVSIIHVEGDLFFGAAELFEDEVRRLSSDPNIRVVVLRMKNARHLDATAVMALDALHKFTREDLRLLIVSGASVDVMKVLQRSGLVDRLGKDCVFPAEENLTAATRKALLRAKEFLGADEKPEVRIFYEKTRADQKSREKGGPSG